MTKIKVYAGYTVKIYKNKSQFFFTTGGRAPGALVLDPPLNIPAILKREVYQTVTLYLLQIQLIDIRQAAAKPSNFGFEKYE